MRRLTDVSEAPAVGADSAALSGTLRHRVVAYNAVGWIASGAALCTAEGIQTHGVARHLVRRCCSRAALRCHLLRPQRPPELVQLKPRRFHWLRVAVTQITKPRVGGFFVVVNQVAFGVEAGG